MTPLVGIDTRRRRRDAPYWLLAGLFGLLLHGAVAAAYWWQPAPPPVQTPAAAPMVVDMVMMMAAPQDREVDAPPGPDQTESTLAPAPAPPEVIDIEEELPPLPEVERPAEIQAKPPSEPKTEPQPEPDPEPAQEEAQEEAQDTSDTQAAETTAAPSMPAEIDSERVAAPMQGVFSQQQTADARQQWQHRLSAHLDRHKRYPRQALSLRHQGMPRVTFTLDREGHILDVRLARTSGAGALDNEALALLHRADPVPRPPPEMVGETFTVTVPVDFSIRR